MGQNRRYGTDVSRAAIAETVLRPQPSSLSEAQVGGPVTDSPTPIPVIAWVPFRDTQVELDAHAVAWSPRAVKIRFRLRDGIDRETWVWASAVRRTEPRHG